MALAAGESYRWSMPTIITFNVFQHRLDPRVTIWVSEGPNITGDFSLEPEAWARVRERLRTGRDVRVKVHE
jgi:hypothetical protein